MTFNISASFLFCLLLVVTIKFAAHKVWHALVAFLAGFFIAATGAAPYIDKAVLAVARAIHRA